MAVGDEFWNEASADVSCCTKHKYVHVLLS
jgi:hypothetical protein